MAFEAAWLRAETGFCMGSLVLELHAIDGWRMPLLPA
jgi:hypothetical protein